MSQFQIGNCQFPSIRRKKIGDALLMTSFYQKTIPFKMTQTQMLSNIFWPKYLFQHLFDFAGKPRFIPSFSDVPIRLTWFHYFGLKLLSKREGVNFFCPKKSFWGNNYPENYACKGSNGISRSYLSESYKASEFCCQIASNFL